MCVCVCTRVYTPVSTFNYSGFIIECKNLIKIFLWYIAGIAYFLQFLFFLIVELSFCGRVEVSFSELTSVLIPFFRYSLPFLFLLYEIFSRGCIRDKVKTKKRQLMKDMVERNELVL